MFKKSRSPFVAQRFHSESRDYWFNMRQMHEPFYPVFKIDGEDYIILHVTIGAEAHCRSTYVEVVFDRLYNKEEREFIDFEAPRPSLVKLWERYFVSFR